MTVEALTTDEKRLQCGVCVCVCVCVFECFERCDQVWHVGRPFCRLSEVEVSMSDCVRTCIILWTGSSGAGAGS